MSNPKIYSEVDLARMGRLQLIDVIKAYQDNVNQGIDPADKVCNHCKCHDSYNKECFNSKSPKRGRKVDRRDSCLYFKADL